mmetsp:Transcript_19016/g.24827  ORF Transcript_19016/g.24827 Transcript_19016/m.24827 type:complete len:717 (+) Transcript_19016:159-2309(+)
MSAPGTNKVDFEVRDGVAIVTLDHFPVNTLTNAVSLGLEDSANRIQAEEGSGKIKAVVVRGAGTRAFCAGADLQDINKKHERYPKKPFMEVFESLNVPVVAALQGFTLGGGMELSLGCHYRVIASNGAVGLPEVNIGLLPGGQGTQRLPRLIGAEYACDVMLSGEHIPAKKALELAIVDAVSDPKNLLEDSIKFALSKVNDDLSKRRTSEYPVPPLKDQQYFDKVVAKMKKQRKNQPAPIAIIDCVRAAVTSANFAEGVKEEARLFKTLLGSPSANALQHIFFSERGAAKLSVKAKPAKVKEVGIIGAGTMGGGIAMCFAQIGVKVILVDREQKFLDRGMKVIKGNYARSVKRGSKSQAFVDRALSLISTAVDYSALKNADLVIEAVFEDMKLKKEIFKKLDAACKPECILASNTSYLSIDEMASVTKRPQKVMGMHFFSPANVMKLLENVQGAKTDDQTLVTCTQIGAKIGKWPVLSQNMHGFIGNRMLTFYGTEARNMIMEGALPAQVDKVATDFGMPMGPFAMTDLTGLDIGFQARKRNGNIDVKTNLQDALCESGRLGMKTGAGYYDYKDGRTRVTSELVNDLVLQISANNGHKRRDFSEQEIFERLFYPLINEGFKVLMDGVARQPSDIDVTYCHGYNWPRITGGPMHYADAVGLQTIADRLTAYAEKYPKVKYFAPSDLMRKCVESNSSLTKYWAKNGKQYKFVAKAPRL